MAKITHVDLAKKVESLLQQALDACGDTGIIAPSFKAAIRAAMRNAVKNGYELDEKKVRS